MDNKMSDKPEGKLGCETGNERYGFGFGGRRKENHKKKNKHLGKFVCFENNGHSVLGILYEINTVEGRAEFRPYVVAKGDGSLAIIEDDYTTMNFPFLVKRVMPGTIKQYVDSYNNELRRKRDLEGSKK